MERELGHITLLTEAMPCVYNALVQGGGRNTILFFSLPENQPLPFKSGECDIPVFTCGTAPEVEHNSELFAKGQIPVAQYDDKRKRLLVGYPAMGLAH